MYMSAHHGLQIPEEQGEVQAFGGSIDHRQVIVDGILRFHHSPMALQLKIKCQYITMISSRNE